MGGCNGWLEPELETVGEFDAAFDALLLREDVVRGLGFTGFVPPAAFFRATPDLADFVDFDGARLAFELLVVLVPVKPVARDACLWVAVDMPPEACVVDVVLVDLRCCCGCHNRSMRSVMRQDTNAIAMVISSSSEWS